jgi:hypothetical protein
LARIRALRDAVYGLPIVVCDRCGSAWVRRRHPIVSEWRRCSRITAAAALIVGQFLVIGIGTAVIARLVVLTEHGLLVVDSGFLTAGRALIASPETAVGDWMHREGRFMFLLLGVCSFLAGSWLIATLGHWRVAMLLAAWWMLLSLFQSIEMIGNGWDWLLWRFGGPPPHPTVWVEEWTQRLVGASACALIAGASAPLAILVRRAGPRLTARWRAKRRARIRKQRSGA